MAEKTKVILIGPAKVGGAHYVAGKTVLVTDTEIEHLVEAGALPKGELPAEFSAQLDGFTEGLLSDLEVAREEIADLHDQLAVVRESADKEIAQIRTAADQRILDAETAATKQIDEAQASANDQLTAYRKEADAKVAAIQAELDTLKEAKPKGTK